MSNNSLEEKYRKQFDSGDFHANSLLDSDFGRWFDSEPTHKYNEGDILVLNGGFSTFGYGIRPVIRVEGYKLKNKWHSKKPVGYYDVIMSIDADFIPIFNKHGEIVDNAWIERNCVPKGVERILKEVEISKWNIEFQFQIVPEGTSFEDALKLYRSTEKDYFFELR